MVAFALLLLINELFIVKYAGRALGLMPTVGVMLAYGAIAFALKKFRIPIKKQVLLGFLVVWCLAILFIWYKVPPAQINVDRWDAIVHWWHGVFAGEFPWSTRTRFDGFPSPLPILQLLYLPFVPLGYLGGLLLLTVVGVTIYLVRFSTPAKGDNQSAKKLYAIDFFWLASPAIIWELAVHSTLIMNAVLFVAFLLILGKVQHKLVWAAVFSGLILSTRLNWALPILFLVTAYYLEHRQIKNILLYGVLTVLAFGVTFLPIILQWGISDFAVHNPFYHHSKHMPHALKILLLLFCIGMAFYAKCNTQRKWIAIAFIVIMPGLFYIVKDVFQFGFFQAIYENKTDISYVLFSYPVFWLIHQEYINRHPKEQEPV